MTNDTTNAAIDIPHADDAISPGLKAAQEHVTENALEIDRSQACTCSGSQPVASHRAEIELIEEMRWARKALATSLESSEDQSRYLRVLAALRNQFGGHALKRPGS